MTNNHRTPFTTIRAEVAILSVGRHQRVRLASKQKGVQTHVEPNLLPDVLGIYVYLPKV